MTHFPFAIAVSGRSIREQSAGLLDPSIRMVPAGEPTEFDYDLVA
jgi:hypothetical protein